MQNNLKIGWLYCYMIGSKSIFLNRWDETIKIFNTYEEAEKYANNNPCLIDIRCKDNQ